MNASDIAMMVVSNWLEIYDSNQSMFLWLVVSMSFFLTLNEHGLKTSCYLDNYVMDRLNLVNYPSEACHNTKKSMVK